MPMAYLTYATSLLYLQVRKQFSFCGWESKDAKGWLYTLFYIILYKELDHSQIWVFTEIFTTHPLRDNFKGQY